MAQYLCFNLAIFFIFITIARDMDNIPVLIRYKGEWTIDNKFEGYEVKGVLIPNDCSYEHFIVILSEQFKINTEKTLFKIKYFVKDFPLQIDDDNSMRFFLELKKRDSDLIAYPLCITLIDQDPIIELELPTTNSSSLEDQPLLALQGNISEMMGYVSILSRDTIEKTKDKADEEEQDTGTTESITINNPRYPNIEAGQLYDDKETLKKALSFFALKNSFQYKVHKSCVKRYVLNCVDENCRWQLRASRMGNTSIFKIRKFNNIHTCPLQSRIGNQRQATANVIGEIMKTKFLNVKSVYTPHDIIREMKVDFGVTINYGKAWRSKAKALELFRGNPEESYALLPNYLYMLKSTNPGSVVDIQTGENGTFLYLFIALGASIMGWKHCRPIVVVDGTFLKSKHGGTLITACTQNAAGKIYPLAFAVVDSENDCSWEWFFMMFRETYGIRESMCIISDRHDSIEKATKKILPDVSHCVCTYHLWNNLKTKFKKNSSKIKDLFFGASAAYTIEDFENKMDVIDKVDSRIITYLTNVGFEKWSRVHSLNNRFSMMTSNIAESMNAANKSARELPIVALVEYLRELTQEWNYKNRQLALSTFTTLATRHEETLRKNYIVSQKMMVKALNDDAFTVKEYDKSHVINMKERSCSCNHFQMDELPCPHALAVVSEFHLNPYDYCSIYHTKDSMLATYEASVYPIPEKRNWKIPTEVEEELVLPPIGRVKAGRPKKRRIKSGWESKLKLRCGKCKEFGHNRKTCRNAAK